MNTLTLSEQMQVIMEKVPEPAILNVDFYEVYDTQAEISAYATADTARREHNVVVMGNGENPCNCWPWKDAQELADYMSNTMVSAANGCPLCGEQRVDYLETYEDDVACLTCGHGYQLPQPARFCHCGQPLDDGACECEHCSAEWNEFLMVAADVRGNLTF